MSSSVLLHKLQLVFNPDESFICQLRHSKIFFSVTNFLQSRNLASNHLDLATIC